MVPCIIRQLQYGQENGPVSVFLISQGSEKFTKNRKSSLSMVARVVVFGCKVMVNLQLFCEFLEHFLCELFTQICPDLVGYTYESYVPLQNCFDYYVCCNYFQWYKNTVSCIGFFHCQYIFESRRVSLTWAKNIYVLCLVQIPFFFAYIFIYFIINSPLLVQCVGTPHTWLCNV